MSCGAFAGPAVGALTGALTASVGTFLVHRHLDRRRRVEHLRRTLGEFLDLATGYWTAKPDAAQHAIDRMRLNTHWDLMGAELKVAGKADGRVRLACAGQDFIDARADLWLAATGGNYGAPHAEWEPDPERPSKATQAVVALLDMLPA